MQKVDKNTTYTDRISVAGDASSENLTIVDVRLSDEREFFCQVNGLAAGTGEGRTQLKVFSKSASFPPQVWLYILNLSGVYHLLPVYLDPPEPPMIEAVYSGISVTTPLPSKVGRSLRSFMQVHLVLFVYSEFVSDFN